MNEIEWADPPAPGIRGHRGQLQSFVAALRARPGAWAKYEHSHSSPTQACDVRHRFPGTETRAVRREDGRFDLYARWIGVPS